MRAHRHKALRDNNKAPFAGKPAPTGLMRWKARYPTAMTCRIESMGATILLVNYGG